MGSIVQYVVYGGMGVHLGGEQEQTVKSSIRGITTIKRITTKKDDFREFIQS